MMAVPFTTCKINNFVVVRVLLFFILKAVCSIYIINAVVYNSVSIPETSIIYWISCVIMSCYSGRIYAINNKDRVKSVLVVIIVCLVVHHTLTSYENFNWMRDTQNLIFIFFYSTPILMSVFFVVDTVKCKWAALKGDVKNYERYYRSMVEADADAGFISEMDCYLRAAPIQIVQLARVFYYHGDLSKISVAQEVSIAFAFGLVPWYITAFHGSRTLLQTHRELPIESEAVYYLSNFCIMSSRIISIACAAAFWPEYTGLAVAAHWLGATAWMWIKTKPTPFCGNTKFCHVFFCMIFGEFYIFRPMNLGENSPRRQYVWFYIISFVENMVATSFWAYNEKQISDYVPWIVVLTYAFYFCGIILTAIYYQRYHVTENVDVTIDNGAIESV